MILIISAESCQRIALLPQGTTTYHGITGGNCWSPDRNSSEARSPFYDSMREVAPGDITFSFRDTRIAALGIDKGFIPFEDHGELIVSPVADRAS
jgi:hypothetical protein